MRVEQDWVGRSTSPSLPFILGSEGGGMRALRCCFLPFLVEGNDDKAASGSSLSWVKRVRSKRQRDRGVKRDALNYMSTRPTCDNHVASWSNRIVPGSAQGEPV
ncbi:hypothetical protein B296_00002237 [Ensete ventricosum]|uniref:Uncharacterized protein n=1 Tax=Ensete ventricosum TaxID=4639 RepID=A0A427B8R7_ENSVE|nr:hypothetical protein B296_00002237 [Ensete ventricosum]